MASSTIPVAPAPPAVRRRFHYAFVVTAITFLVLVVGAGVRATPGVLIAALEEEYGWTREVISGAVAINILLYGLLGPFIVGAFLSYGLPLVVSLSLTCLGIGVALASVMQGPGATALLYILWGLLVGVGSAGVATVLGAVVADRWFARHKSLVVGFFSASNATGSLLFAPLLAYIVEHSPSGWRAAVWVMGGAALALVPPTAVLLKDRPEHVGTRKYGEEEEAVEGAKEGAEPTAAAAALSFATAGKDASEDEEEAGETVRLAAPATPTPSATAARGAAAASQAQAAPPSAKPANPIYAALSALVQALPHPDFWLLAGSFFVCGASTNGLIGTHFVPACIDSGMGEVAAAGMLSAMGALDIAGTLGSGYLTDYHDPRLLLCLYYGLRGAALAFLPTALRLPVKDSGLWPYAVVYGLDWIATVPPTKKLCDNCFPGKGSLIFGWCLAAHQVGAACAASAAGAVRTHHGSYDGAFYFSGALCGLTAAAVWALGRGGGKGGQASAAPGAVPGVSGGGKEGPGAADARAAPAASRRQADAENGEGVGIPVAGYGSGSSSDTGAAR